MSCITNLDFNVKKNSSVTRCSLKYEKVATTRIRKEENLKSNLSLLIISNDQCQRDHFSGPSSDIIILFIVHATILNSMLDYAEILFSCCFFLMLLLLLLLLTLRSFDAQTPKRFHLASGNLKPFALWSN